MTVHLEGMGLLGSLTALRLAHEGVPFTWHDTDAEFTAWRACTGMVYPAGDERSMEGLTAWWRWLSEGWLPPGVAEQVSYVFRHRHPPHEGRYSVIDLGDMRIADTPAVAVNVPALVLAARERFADLRRPGRVEADRQVVAHGFNDRLAKVMWGWNVRVQLDTAPLANLVRRPAFYSRRQRFQIVYAYPIPGERDWWWAGSSLVGQSQPRHLDPLKHFARWREAWAELWPTVPVVATGEALEGWRPRPADDDAQRLRSIGGRLVFPPLWHSGVRWAPSVIDAAVRQLTGG